ncbi:hypothetical protein D3C72_1169410 [compost metagenome]
MGQFMHQRATPRTTGAGHVIIQKVATQRDASGEGTAMYIGRQVIAPAHLYLRRQCSQQAFRQQ